MATRVGILLGLLLVHFCNCQSVSNISTNFCRQNDNLDNFSCDVNQPIEGTSCFNRSELCNINLFCSGGEDEGDTNVVSSLNCIGGESSLSCGLGMNVGLPALCDGVDDCGAAGGNSGIDEDLVICDNKCLLPFYGGCSLTTICDSQRGGVDCGPCLPGYFRLSPEDMACTPFIDLSFDGPPSIAIPENEEGTTEVCITATLRPDLFGFSTDSIASSTEPVFAVTITATGIFSPLLPVDYSVASSTIQLNPVTNPRSCFVITVFDDSILEGDENVTLTVVLSTDIIQQLQPTSLTQLIVIVDDEFTSPEFGFPENLGFIAFTGSEASGEVQVTVSILNGGTLGEAVTVQLSAQGNGDDNEADADDFSASNFTVTFNPSSLSASVSVPVVDDFAVEDPEEFLLFLSEPSVGSIRTSSSIATAVILDNDDPRLGFDPTTYFIAESAGFVETTIVITNGVSFQPGVTRSVSISFENPDLVLDGVDSSPFNASVQLSLDVPLDNMFILTLSTNSSDVSIDTNSRTAEVTVLDGEILSFGFDQVDVSGNEADGIIEVSVFKANENVGDLTLTITPFTFSQFDDSGLSLPGGLPEFMPNPADENDFTSSSITIIFPPSESDLTQTVSIPITNDNNFEFLVEGFYLLLTVSDSSDDRDLIRSVPMRNVTLVSIVDDEIARFRLPGSIANHRPELVFPPILVVEFIPGAALFLDVPITVNVIVIYDSGSNDFQDTCSFFFPAGSQPGTIDVCILTVNAIESAQSINIFPSSNALERVVFDRIIIPTDNDNSCEADTTEVAGSTLSWPQTEAGILARLPCPSPDPSTASVTRLCNNTAMWLQVNTAACLTVQDINNLQLEVSETTIEVQATTFARVLALTQEEELLQSEEILASVATFFLTVSRIVESNLTGTGANRTIAPMVVQGLVESIGTLQQWDPSILSSSGNSSRIIMSFEVVAGEFAEQISAPIDFMESGFIFVAENFILGDLQELGRSVTFLSEDFRTSDAPIEGQNLSLSSDALAAVSLPPSLFRTVMERDTTDTIGLFFTFYDDSTLFPVRDTTFDSTLRPAVASGVVGAAVGPGLVFVDLGSDATVEIILRRRNTFPGSVNASCQLAICVARSTPQFVRNGSETCVSWDFDLAGGLGNWTAEGCETIATNGDEVTCRCNHLTNFAILVDICTRTADCESRPLAVDSLLSVITYVGVAISLFSLVATIMTLLLFKDLRKRDISKFHIQLSIAIFCMLLVFLAGVDRTEVYGGCVAVSALLHYFALASVFWMGAEAILMFEKLVLVFKKVTTKRIVVFSLVCWITPLVPVLIPLLIDVSSGPGSSNDLVVRRDEFCFLSNPYVFWFAFLGPVIVITLFNSVVCVIVTIVLIKHARRSMARKNESKDKDKAILHLMLRIAGVMCLFGLSWLFGALTITIQEVRILFEILFAISTSLQGFFIFLFFCVFNQTARELWKETLSCGRYQSKMLNPSLRFTGGARPRPNISHKSTSTGSRVTMETSLTFQRPSSSNGQQQDSENERYTKMPFQETSTQDHSVSTDRGEAAKNGSKDPTGLTKQSDLGSNGDSNGVIYVNTAALDGEADSSEPSSAEFETSLQKENLPEDTESMNMSDIFKPVPKKRSNMKAQKEVTTKPESEAAATPETPEMEDESSETESAEIRIKFD